MVHIQLNPLKAAIGAFVADFFDIQKEILDQQSLDLKDQTQGTPSRQSKTDVLWTWPNTPHLQPIQGENTRPIKIRLLMLRPRK